MKKIFSRVLSLVLAFALTFGAAPAQAASPLSVSTPKLYLDASYDQVALSWTEPQVSGQQKNENPTLRYKVYRRVDGGKWKKTEETTQLSATDLKARPGHTYEYKIMAVAVSASGKGTAESAVNKVTISLPVPEVISVEPMAYNEIQVSFQTVPGISKYLVYRRSGNGEYKKIATVLANESAHRETWTDAKVRPGKKYSYLVRARLDIDGKAYRSEIDESKALSAKTKLSRPNITKLKTSGCRIKVAWTAVNGASGYILYRREAGGIWQKIGSFTGTSYLDTAVAYKTDYQYKVIARYKNGSYEYDSKASKVKQISFKPKASSIQTMTVLADNRIRLTWKKTTGAAGYAIYRKAGYGSYQRVATVKGETETSWTDTGLTYGTNYTYKVRAYWNVGNKKQFGAKSKGQSRVLEYESKYSGGYKLFYDDEGTLVTTNIDQIIGPQSEYEIRVNKQMNTVTVYAKDGYRGFIIPVRACITSCGEGTPTGTFYMSDKYRWHELVGSVYGQYSMRITGSIMFHTVYYYTNYDNTTLSVDAYNKLGSLDSKGCARLTVGDAKWIYDRCGSGTKVTIYNSGVSGPLGKPTSYQLPSWHTWDPTDPEAYHLCEEHGCH